jgi:secernin
VCDTLCIVTPTGTLFAKNSDRPPQEAQVAESYEPRVPGGTIATQYLTLPDPGSYALLGSRPEWLWGFEHGVNEHRVAIGNEKVWTVDDAKSLPPAFLGMDLVRLALERARSADDALEHLTALLEAHGQGGSGEHDHFEPYFSSFLIADPRSGWVVETSGRTWAARPVGRGAAISNRISLSTDWTRASANVAPGRDFQDWRDPKAPTAIADLRLDATRACVAAGASGPADLVATLRHHGDRAWGAPGSDPGIASPVPTEVDDQWNGVTVCMHLGDYQATTASIVAELPADSGAPVRAWVALGSPCASVYVPVFPPHAVPAALGLPATWHRFATLRKQVESGPDQLAVVREVLAPLEAELWENADRAVHRGTRGAVEEYTATTWPAVEDALHRLHV